MEHYVVPPMSRPYQSEIDNPVLVSNQIGITKNNISGVLKDIAEGESMENILELLRNTASNAAIAQIANRNGMLGVHRSDFQHRAMEIVKSRRRQKS